MFAQQLGWYYNLEDDRRVKESKQSNEKAVTRVSEFIDFFGADYTLILPDCKLLYVLNYFEELGRYKINGMTETPLDYPDFYYWMQCTGRKLNAWEINTLIKMSEHFLSYKNNPEPVKPPYYSQEIKNELIEIQRSYNEIARQINLQK